jgi:hypothetical protein
MCMGRLSRKFWREKARVQGIRALKKERVG